MSAIAKATVGDGIAAANAGWTFSNEVARTFSSHVSKSVPLYAEGHDLICTLSDFFVQDSSVCYELGSSTGVLERQARAAARRDRKPTFSVSRRFQK